jgi:hypothetical protein
MNPHAVLGVRRDATPSELRSAWRRAARATHPDRGGDAADFAVVASAYARLGQTAPPQHVLVVSRLGVGHLARRWLRRRFARGPSRVE